MQLLDKSLGDVVDASGPLLVEAVFDIADQLIAALEHMHTRGIVHRDIKPDNILFQPPESRNVCLIDFGFAYPPPSATEVAESLPRTSEMTTVFGTLPYASLNAHRGLKLTYRDDLESSAYTLLYLLRGSLPWSHYTRHGTVYGRIRQVYKQKQRLGGSELAAGLPDEFGELVDYARFLSPEELPRYQHWLDRLKVAQARNQDVTCNQNHSAPGLKGSQPPSPVQPGQLALLRLIPSVTAEGYSIQANHERSYIRDPSFDAPEWSFPRKPCVILEVNWDERAKTYSFTVAAISNRDELERCNPLLVSILGSDSVVPYSQTTISTKPDWPFERSYCYAFKRLAKIYCLPSQKAVSSHWTIESPEIEIISKKLTPPPNPDPFALLHDSESPDPDTRYDAKMRTGYVKHYAELSPLTPTEINDQSIQWNSTRGWFDECVKASKYYDECNGYPWTRDPRSQTSEGSETDFSDSYSEEDVEDWERQRERDRSLTLGTVLKQREGQMMDLLDGLDDIELVE
ncbi:Casein kinase I [Rhizoctonia solani]|uniref:non-specific serine/threonine protein kinase n=1 Tax=Rhizoctonia solani TaxID=456999 RepID=A0A0K6FRQ0_9AGAM|nr:Casein kinase I [Rhizoctonia solani]